MKIQLFEKVFQALEKHDENQKQHKIKMQMKSGQNMKTIKIFSPTN
jgi:hypothetical protein